MKFLSFVGRGLSRLIQSLPVRGQRLLGYSLGILWFDILRIRRNVVLGNIQLAFPKLSEHERVKLARTSLMNFGLTLIEYTRLPFLDPTWVDKNCIFEGLEHLDHAFHQKKGVCLLTLHLGNGDLAIACLSLKGYPMTLISKEFSFRTLNDLWFGMRRKLGTKFIPPRNSSLAVSRALKNNEAVLFVMDQFTGPPIGTRSKFFGVETGTGLGLATMAKRRQSPVVLCYTYRDGDGRHRICFDQAFDPITESESLASVTQGYNDHLERIVRRFPEQWMWIHRRWKSFNDPDEDRGMQGSGVLES